MLLVPDDVAAITAAIRAHAADLVLCTGGTGLGPGCDPDAVLSVIDRELPGFGEAFRARGRAQTPLADLSRAVAGSMGATLVVAIPGSHGAVADGLAVLGPLLEHAHHVVQEPTTGDWSVPHRSLSPRWKPRSLARRWCGGRLRRAGTRPRSRTNGRGADV